jgi:Uma2 family endonuclease
MSAQPIPRVPPLQPGDHLTVAEFERRYQAMPALKKAELIEGVVYMPSPVTLDDHAAPHFDFIGWLSWYRAHTPGVQGGDNSSLRLHLGLNEPQPDAFLRIRPEYGGRSRTSDDGYVVGSPEWIGEVSASSASYDLHEKLAAYQRNEVQEYVVWRVLDRAIDWFCLRAGKFRPLPRDKNSGYFQSKVLPGLWLDPEALIQGDLPKVLRVLQQGLATPAHERFVEKLKKWQERHAGQSA